MPLPHENDDPLFGEPGLLHQSSPGRKTLVRPVGHFEGATGSVQESDRSASAEIASSRSVVNSTTHPLARKRQMVGPAYCDAAFQTPTAQRTCHAVPANASKDAAPGKPAESISRCSTTRTSVGANANSQNVLARPYSPAARLFHPRSFLWRDAPNPVIANTSAAQMVYCLASGPCQSQAIGFEVFTRCAWIWKVTTNKKMTSPLIDEPTQFAAISDQSCAALAEALGLAFVACVAGTSSPRRTGWTFDVGELAVASAE